MYVRMYAYITQTANQPIRSERSERQFSQVIVVCWQVTDWSGASQLVEACRIHSTPAPAWRWMAILPMVWPWASGLFRHEEDQSIIIKVSARCSSTFKVVPENCVSSVTELPSREGVAWMYAPAYTAHKNVFQCPCGLLLSGAEPPSWVSDVERKECHSCLEPFNFFRRRHHCRNCGEVCTWMHDMLLRRVGARDCSCGLYAADR